MIDNTADIDIWKKIRKRAEELRKISESISEISDDEKDRIFKERSKKLSRVGKKLKEDKNFIKFISFYVAGEYYGIEVKYLKEVYEVNIISRIPCVPPVLSGLINYRGSVLTIINLENLFNLKKNKVSDLKDEDGRELKESSSYNILVFDNLATQAGIIIDRYDDLLDLPVSSIQPVSTFFQEKNKIVKSEVRLNNVPLLIIDPEELLNDKRLFINEDI